MTTIAVTKDRPFFLRGPKSTVAVAYWLKGRPPYDTVRRIDPQPDKGRVHHAIGLTRVRGEAEPVRCGIIIVLDLDLIDHALKSCEDFKLAAILDDADGRADDDGMAPVRERA